MIEANVEIYIARDNILKATVTTERTVLDNFVTARAILLAAGAEMTNPQKLAVLGELTAARTERIAAQDAVDEAFNSATPL